MKKLLSLILLAFALQSCGERTQKATNENNPDTEEQIQTNIIPTEFISPLRPNEKLQIGKIYTDTVEFIELDDNGDNPLMFINKNKNTASLIYDWTVEYDFVKGEEIEIRWKMDSIRYVGDPEFLQYKEFVISARKIKSKSSEKDFSKIKNQSFVISCGTGCAMTHNVKEIIQISLLSIKVIFEVDMYVDEQLSETFDLVHIFYYDKTGNLQKIISEEDKENVLEIFTGQAQQSFRDFGAKLFN